MKTYIICFVGRSGSTLLARSLAELGYVGNPIEFFHWRRIPQLAKSDSQIFKDYLDEIRNQGTTSNGVCGIKLQWGQLQTLTSMARTHLSLNGKKDVEIISLLFPNPYYIYIERNNLLKQAISLELAQQTGVFTKFSDTNSKQIETSLSQQLSNNQLLIFKPLNIFNHKKNINITNQKWQNFFELEDINYYKVVYEDFSQSIPQTIINVIKFLEIEPLPSEDQIKIPLKRLSNEINDQWFKYYNYIPEIFLKLGDLINKKFGSIAKKLIRR
ncbi:Stf0 family sulfotransferase [Cyanobacterium sp. HL-69]|uniref:Stf0 family sulfotransferase n=1 Tax=Cyanobacterium sp. HL-69 TaxID=2054282 RepID=UPI00406BC2E1